MAMGKVPDGEGEGGIFSEINITPLTDIFLVLLIIFMVTASAASEAGTGGVKLNLPQGGAADATKVEKPLDIFVLTDGRIMIDGSEANEATLTSRLQTELKAQPQLVVRVRADKALHHGRVVEVLDIVKKSGVARLSIATQVRGQ